jgi:hypothetical protein
MMLSAAQQIIYWVLVVKLVVVRTQCQQLVMILEHSWGLVQHVAHRVAVDNYIKIIISQECAQIVVRHMGKIKILIA